MAKLKITSTTSVTNVTYPQNANAPGDRYAGPQYINSAYVGGTGGLTSQAGRQIQGQVYVKGSSSQQGSILLQKGAHKFRVQDAGGKQGVCTLVNSPNPIAGQMNILLTLNNSTAAIAAANVSGNATSTTVTFSSVTGPLALPRVGDYLSFGSAPSGNISTFTQVTAMNGSTATITTTGNVASSSVAVSVCSYASKINNRHVWDWYSDGQMDSTNGTITFYSNGYNPTRWKYHLATPDSTYIQVQYA